MPRKKTAADVAQAKRDVALLKAEVKELRKYVKSLRSIDLRKKVSSGKKSYVTKLWREYQELTARPHKLYRTKDKKKLAIAQDFSRHDKSKPRFDVAFVPTPDPHAKLIFKADRAIIKSKHVTETVLFFDAKKLASNAKQHIADTLARNTAAKQFVIMSGKYLYNGGLARSLVEREVLDLMSRYNKREENNYWSNWLFGIAAYEFNTTGEFLDYRAEHFSKRAAIKKTKRNERRRRVQKYGKKG